ncbi:hypothetical protein SBADM41S_03299 [Streptomyces badius]
MGIEYGVRDARLPVEVDEVEVAAEEGFHDLDHLRFSALLVRQAQVDQLVHPVGVQQGESPDDERARVVADEGGVLVAVVVQERLTRSPVGCPMS